MSLLKRIVQILLFFLILNHQIFANSVESEVPEDVVLVAVEQLEHQEENLLSVNFKNYKKWHTYWKNPGDAGLPLKVIFKDGEKEFELESLEWPIPKRYLEEGNLWAYGYSNDYSLFFKLPSGKVKELDGKRIEILSSWLVCKHICVPGKQSIFGRFDQGQFQAENNDFRIEKSELTQRAAALPKVQELPGYVDLVLAKDPKKDLGLVLYSNITVSAPQPLLNDINLLTPFPSPPFTYLHEKVFKDKKGNYYGKFPIDWDGEYQEPPIDLPKDGNFLKPFNLRFLFADPITQSVYIIEKEFKSYNLNAAESSEKLLKMLAPINIGKSAPKEVKEMEVVTVDESSSLFYYLILAFIGGFILNFMPCVLPVISMKLFGLISHLAESKSRILKHNIFYSIGVLLSFLVLAIVVIALQKAGTYVGWGFQLQSPTFIALTIVVLFTMALNLFGLFEFITPGGGKLGNVELSDSYAGDIFSGVIATILSTPCSAPFLGTALTFAFSSNTPTIISVFLMIGLGLAFPFILTGIFPKLISFLPRPGNWMNHLKKFLGFTLILTVIWLLDIFVSQTDTNTPLLKLTTALLFIFFAFFTNAKISKNKALLSVLFLIPTAIFLNLVFTPMTIVESDQTAKSSLLKEKQALGLNWEKFTPEKLQENLEAGHVTFIDFTAKWCFTCKVNEKLVLDTEDFKKLVNQKNVKLLLADWTKRDEMIGNWLKDHGKVGVPAYFILDRDGKLNNLGETITISKIKKYIK